MRMPENLFGAAVALLFKYKEAFGAVLIGIVGGGLAYLMDVRSGAQKWDFCTFLLAIASAGFFAFVTYMVCLDLFHWTPGLSVAASGMVAHLGADKVKQLLTQFFTSKFR